MIIRISLFLRLALPLCLLITPAAATDVDFLKDVYPLFEKHCNSCHGPKKQKGNLRFDRYEGWFEGEEDFIPVVPGKPELSTVIEFITLDEDDPDLMPKKAAKLSDEDIHTIRTWIEEGAKWEQPPEPEVAPDPLQLPALTPEQLESRARALVALERAGLKASVIAEGRDALEVNLSLMRKEGGDEHVAVLSGLEPVLIWANLSGTSLTDSGLAQLGSFNRLRRLNLSGTAITDAGLRHLAGLGELRSLNLYNTAVTDAGLVHLRGLANLERLYLWGTEVSEAGAQAFRAQRDTIRVNIGTDLVVHEIKAEPPINELCPVKGKPVNPACMSLLDGKKVGLCCGDCKAVFEADPEAYRAKLPGFEKGPINDLCPVSGKQIAEGCTSEYEGKLVGFCCGKCKAEFEKDPNPLLEKLGLVPAPVPQVLNTVCPVGDKPAKPEVTTTYKGRKVAFCCSKCKGAFEADPEMFIGKLDKE